MTPCVLDRTSPSKPIQQPSSILFAHRSLSSTQEASHQQRNRPEDSKQS